MMNAAEQARTVRPWLIASLACAALLFSASGQTAFLAGHAAGVAFLTRAAP